MRSIRRGLQLPLLIGVPLLTLLMGLMSALLVTDRLRNDFDAALRAKAKVFASLTQYVGADRQIEFNFSDELMPEFALRERLEYFELWNAQGQLVERSHSLRTSRLPRGVLPVGVASLRDYRTGDDRPGRLIQSGFIPDQPDDQQQSVKTAPDTLILGVGTDHLEALVWRVYLIDLVSTLLLAVVFSGLIHRVLDRRLRPLAEVATQVAGIGVGNLGARLEVSSTAEELGPVMATDAVARGIRLSTRQHVNREVLSDAELLQMLLRDLFRNAVQYSPTHSEVEVSLQRWLDQSSHEPLAWTFALLCSRCRATPARVPAVCRSSRR